MTRKQIKKNAMKILAWETTRSDPNTTEKDKRDAENNILQLTNMLMSLPDGFAVMAEIDEVIQRQLANEKKMKNEEND